ncbi:MAG: hypothetical protein QM708_12015 [Propioniciclava sp.]|uniref:hypothetical protein n=1 Tax=Propioniciclava sp. TaxID=2038686 RepID=UPI0039E34468
MAIYKVGFESGTDGAALTAALAGFSTRSVNGGTHTFSAAMAARGALGASFQCAANAGTFCRWTPPADMPPSSKVSFSGIVTLPTTPFTGDVTILGFPNAAGSYNSQRVISVRANGGFYALNSQAIPGTVGANLWGQRIRVAVALDLTAKTVTARAYAAAIPGSWTSPLGETLELTGLALTSDQVVGMDVGIPGPSGGPYVLGWDELQLLMGQAVLIGDNQQEELLPTPVFAQAAITQPSRFGAKDGTIAVAWNDAGAPAVYEVSVVPGDVDVAPIQRTGVRSPQIFSGLEAGTHTVFVRRTS